jgi:hypothetical protein
MSESGQEMSGEAGSYSVDKEGKPTFWPAWLIGPVVSGLAVLVLALVAPTLKN